MKFAAAALSLVLMVPGLAQSQAPAPPYLLDPGELPPPTSTPGSWPAADGSGVGLRHSDCPSTGMTPYTGSSTLTTGTTIHNKSYSGQLTVAGNNVTISCSDITNPGGNYGVLVGRSGGSANNTLITKSIIHNINTSGNHQGKAIYNTGYSTNLTVEYSEFTAAEDFIHSEGSDAVFHDNWFHNVLADAPGGPNLHCDAIAVASGANVTIRNNRFDRFAGLSLAMIMVQPAGSCPSMTNIDIISNYIDGDGNGNVVLLDKSTGCTCPTGMDLTNNVFGPLAYPPASTPFTYGSGDKACTPVSQRGGSCSGNKLSNGSSTGC